MVNGNAGTAEQQSIKELSGIRQNVRKQITNQMIKHKTKKSSMTTLAD